MIKITLKPKKPFQVMTNDEKALFAARLLKNVCINNTEFRRCCNDCPLALFGSCTMFNNNTEILPKDWVLSDD